MTKKLVCADVGFDCGYTAEAQTEEALLKLVAEHAKTEHGMTKITDDVRRKVKEEIRTV